MMADDLMRLEGAGRTGLRKILGAHSNIRLAHGSTFAAFLHGEKIGEREIETEAAMRAWVEDLVANVAAEAPAGKKAPRKSKKAKG